MKLYYFAQVGIVSAVTLLTGCNKDQKSTSFMADTNSQAASDQPYANTNSPTGRADNTGRNVRDRDDATLTPGDQGETDADRTITRAIRQAINANPQLSTTAKNIKIITSNGRVTLRGPVNSEQEKQTIGSLAQQPGVTIDNQLETKPTNQPSNQTTNQ
jgi:hyperosmotically inducible protein